MYIASVKNVKVLLVRRAIIKPILRNVKNGEDVKVSELVDRRKIENSLDSRNKYL